MFATMCGHTHLPYTELHCANCGNTRLEINVGSREKPRWILGCKCTGEASTEESIADIMAEWRLNVLRRLMDQAIGNPLMGLGLKAGSR